MTRGDWVGLFLVFVAFCVVRLPLMQDAAAGLDEEFYGVPGAEVARTGLPAIPFLPSRDPKTIYYHADELLYALPPLHFYLSAPWHMVLGPGLFAARVASLTSGLLMVLAVARLASRWSHAPHAGLWAGSLLLLSRGFLFPATMARPDMTALALGLWAVVVTLEHRDKPGAHGLGAAVCAGLLAGLAGLSHPVAVVPAAQAGLAWLFARGAPIRTRLTRGLMFGIAAVLTIVLLWSPLIWGHPDWFRIQFGGNVTGRAGPGLIQTLLWPWPALADQAYRMRLAFGPAQVVFSILVLIACCARAWSRRCVEPAATVLVGTSLLVLFLGRHSIQGYYVYPASLVCAAGGGLIAKALALAARNEFWRRWATPAAVAAALLIHAPGAGLRVVVEHARRWGDPSSTVEGRVAEVLAQVPESARLAVSAPFVQTVYHAGRPTVAAIIDPFYFDVRESAFDLAIVGTPRSASDFHFMKQLESSPIASFGRPDDPVGLFVQVYRRLPSINEKTASPAPGEEGRGPAALSSRP
jgi:4-amino-4-deoxy-L-arabinose transferase-like glycosyltransferase